MIIDEANLCLRFYTCKGWTRSLVAELSDKVELFDVLPRYFDDRDKLTENLPYSRNRLEIEGEFTDCEHYAVYNKSFWWPDKDKLSEHEINYRT